MQILPLRNALIELAEERERIASEIERQAEERSFESAQDHRRLAEIAREFEKGLRL